MLSFIHVLLCSIINLKYFKHNSMRDFPCRHCNSITIILLFSPFLLNLFDYTRVIDIFKSIANEN